MSIFAWSMLLGVPSADDEDGYERSGLTDHICAGRSSQESPLGRGGVIGPQCAGSSLWLLWLLRLPQLMWLLQLKRLAAAAAAAAAAAVMAGSGRLLRLLRLPRL